MKQTTPIPTENKNNVTSISDLVNRSSLLNAYTNSSIETTIVITNNNLNSIELTKLRVRNLIVDR